jgi:hypothetical protein
LHGELRAWEGGGGGRYVRAAERLARIERQKMLLIDMMVLRCLVKELVKLGCMVLNVVIVGE